MKKSLLFIAACFAMFFFGIACVAIGTINEFLTTTYHVDKIFIGFIASLLAAGSLIGSLAFGPIVDRFGYKPILLFSVIGIFIGLEGIAYTKDLVLIQLFFFLIGIAGGIINGATNSLVADLYEDKKGSYLSFLGVFWGIGALGLPLLTSILLKIGMTYQSIISLIGCLVFIPLIMFIFLKFPIAKHSEGLPIKKCLQTLKNPIILLFGFFLFFQSGIEAIVNTWTPKYFAEILSLSTEKSLFALTVLASSLTIARIFLGIILKKIEPYKVMQIGLLIALVGIFILLTGIKSYPIMLVAMSLIGIGISGSFPIMLGYVGTIFADISGTAFSVVLVIALIGNMLLNNAVGFIFEKFGIGSLSVFLLIEIVIMFIILSLIIKKVLKKELMG